jgi:hypothetical protein
MPALHTTSFPSVCAASRRQASTDFKSAASAHLLGKTDPEVLALAAQEGRLLVTQDVRTMPQHFGNFVQQGNRSPGVILVPQTVPVAVAIEALILIWSATDQEDWSDRIVRIPVESIG